MTQEQWNEMVVAQLKETKKKLEAGTAVSMSQEEGLEIIMKQIRQAAAKERQEAEFQYSKAPAYESV